MMAVFGASFKRLVNAFSVCEVAYSSSTPLTAKIKISTAPSAYSPVKKAASEAAIIKNSTFSAFSSMVFVTPSTALANPPITKAPAQNQGLIAIEEVKEPATINAIEIKTAISCHLKF